MKQELKEFIEKNIELIDAENYTALFLKCYDDESSDTFLELQHTLGCVGIDYQEDRDIALHIVLDEKIYTFISHTYGPSIMNLHEFVSTYIDHHFGIGYTAIEEFMIEHAYDWKNKVKIIEPQSWGKSGSIMKV